MRRTSRRKIHDQVLAKARLEHEGVAALATNELVSAALSLDSVKDHQRVTSLADFRREPRSLRAEAAEPPLRLASKSRRGFSTLL